MAIAEKGVKVGEFEWLMREVVPEVPQDKPPVVCLHGIVSQSYSWRKTLPEIAAIGRRAIAPDWLGMGFSDRPGPSEFPYTPDAYVEALGQFLDALSIERCTLVAQGFLGSAGVQFALRHPERIERLVICNMPLAPAHSVPFKIKQMGWPLIGDMITQDPLLADRTLEGGGPYQVADEDLDVYRRPFLQTSSSGRALLAAVKKLQVPAVTTEISTGLKAWSQPTLVIWGLSDPWLSLDACKETINGLPDGTLETLEEVGHYVQEDWPEKVNEVLIPFLRRQG